MRTDRHSLHSPHCLDCLPCEHTLYLSFYTLIFELRFLPPYPLFVHLAHQKDL